MALRIRVDGRILCAAMHEAEPNDIYIGDGLHYELSAMRKIIVTEPMEKHRLSGEWWWSNEVPPDVEIADYYLD